VRIHEAVAEDWPAIWPFFHEIVAARETYAYDPGLGEQEARALWMPGPPDRTVVAVGAVGTVDINAAGTGTGSETMVLGSAKMGPNRPGPGAHVATASFMVAPAAAGRGVGRALGEHVLDWARAAGYRAMQFNAVVETNSRAVALWRSLGFEVIGTVPEAFQHPEKGYVGLHVMHRYL